MTTRRTHRNPAITAEQRGQIVILAGLTRPGTVGEESVDPTQATQMALLDTLTDLADETGDPALCLLVVAAWSVNQRKSPYVDTYLGHLETRARRLTGGQVEKFVRDQEAPLDFGPLAQGRYIQEASERQQRRARIGRIAAASFPGTAA